MKKMMLGPVLNGNREKVLDRCRGMVEDGRAGELLYLAASKPLLDRVTRYLVENVRGGLFGRLGVHLLSGFCRWLVSAARDARGRPLDLRARIDVPGRPVAPALVSRLVAELGAKGQLGAFGALSASPGVVASVAGLLGEIQRAGLDADSFAEALKAARRDRAAEDAFDAAASAIYSAYERIQDRHHLTDGCRDYLVAREILSGAVATADGSVEVSVPELDRVRLLVVDGFFDLLPVHMDVLRCLVARVPDTVLLLNEDPDNARAFTAFGDQVETFMSRQWDFEVERAEGSVSRHGALDRLPKYLFSRDEPEPAEVDGADCGVVSVEAPDRDGEIRHVAKAVKRLVSAEGLRPDEIGVVRRDGSLYDRRILDIFAEERIEVDLCDDRPIAGTASVAAAMRVLDAAAAAARFGPSRVPVARLVALARCPLLDPAAGQPRLPFAGRLHPDVLENVAAVVGRDLGVSAWLARARRLAAALGPQDAGSQDVLSSSVSDRRRLGLGPDPAARLIEAADTVERLGRIASDIPARGTAAAIGEALSGALEKLHLGSTVRLRARRTAPGLLGQALAELRAFEGLGRAISAVVEAAELAGTAELGVDAFRADLERALSVESVRVSDGRAGGVRVLGPGDTRGLEFRTVFVVGLVDGEFPARPHEDWIYPAGERAALAAGGVALESHAARDILVREEHYFYQAASRATERLVLLRPLYDDSESETSPSYFIEEVARALGFRRLRPAPSAAGPDVLRISTPVELARAAVRTDTDARVRQALGWLARQTGALDEETVGLCRVEAARRGGTFDAYDGRISDPALTGQLSGLFAAHTFSATELGDYGSCPFRYFLRHVLRLRPRHEAVADLHAADLGVILHEALARALAPVAAAGSSTTQLGRKQLRSVAAEVLAHFAARTPPLDESVWRVEQARILEHLDGWLAAETGLQERLGGAATRPVHLEASFGMPDGEREALRLTRGEDEIRIRGRIDRIDQTDTGDVVVFDYKLNTGPSARDMEAGRDVQLALYLAAVEALFLAPGQQIAGGGYYAVAGQRGSRMANGLYREDFGAAVGAGTSSRHRPESLAAARRRGEQHVWRAYDGLRAGHFEVVPSDGAASCSKCDFSSVCRFDQTRIRAKIAEGDEE